MKTFNEFRQEKLEESEEIFENERKNFGWGPTPTEKEISDAVKAYFKKVKIKKINISRQEIKCDINVDVNIGDQKISNRFSTFIAKYYKLDRGIAFRLEEMKLEIDIGRSNTIFELPGTIEIEHGRAKVTI